MTVMTLMTVVCGCFLGRWQLALTSTPLSSRTNSGALLFDQTTRRTFRTARLNFLTYEEYLDRLDEIASIFSKEAFLSGSLEEYAEETKRKRGTESESLFAEWAVWGCASLRLHSEVIADRTSRAVGALMGQLPSDETIPYWSSTPRSIGAA